jgi:S-adenosylmethionine:tRNA ribosyltransferase-isomerase
MALPRPGGGAPLSLHLYRGERQPDGSFVVRFSWDDPTLAFGELLAQAGLIPLPPYLNREAEAADEDRYQTIYARAEGSVAAPTAGLHFTDAVFAELDQLGIHRRFVTLHVGAGTFRPVKSDTLADHDMHRETIDVSRPLIAQLLAQLEAGLPIIPVGTTSLRTLESVYWYGVQCLQGRAQPAEEIFIGQWEPYEPAHQGVSPIEALRAILRQLPSDGALRGQTQLLIGPGYQYRLIDGLITNFHQPRSTLLLLVAALIGDHWKEAYAYALKNNYRFLSYGDSSLLWRRRL